MAFSTTSMQKTLKGRVDVTGIGVHSGKTVRMSLIPACPDTGVVFLRSGADGSEAEIPALSSSVGATELSTVLGDPRGLHVATVEHLMAALSALAVDNVLIEIDGPEVPVMDGSARAFVEAIDQVGLKVQRVARRSIRVLRSVSVEVGSSRAEFLPFDGRRFETTVEFDSAFVGRQSLGVTLTASSFRSEIAPARTFGFMKDVERLWAAGFALGSSLENSVVIGEEGIVNPDGLRFPDEFVRHKMLDAIGDLALAGLPILGLYRSFRGGHRLNALALNALLAERDAWTIVGGEVRESAVETRARSLEGLVAAFAPEVS
ncbi:UDP-3-O-acyl-N-acetylglucosamine deacetylase [Propylenella binzhouense]|uniref:UDP-3-O-acyl-N-acetylglucosamine deacetylase n=1 Tax=Propylenella binzhouense TaxID=2555902 RepID=A0A964T286_9HYPH|nr:UDP-3-O-acyl-N-acetylglucosamine deacetylase [Propylenella binzhouense]MYZ46944.1 UDP-3-O-acyl-N-acetylglucosamine deacetylase [Propylenella binzhouense]